MSISRSIFDSMPNSFNPKVLELFIKNPDKTYSLTELNKKFGGKDSTLTVDLAMLSVDTHEQSSWYFKTQASPDLKIRLI